MKKFISILLICILLTTAFTGCDRKPLVTDAQTDQESAQDANFSPETTAVSSVGLTEAMDAMDSGADETQNVPAETQAVVSDTPSDEQPVVQDSIAVDEPAADAASEPTLEPAPAVTEEPAIQPFATATPQPNTSITSFTEVVGTGLGFKFSYPTGWNNIPGRNTVCFVQPLENGTVYPARVAVTMKKLPHKCNMEEAQQELVNYIKNLMTQYDESTFKVDKELDTDTKFMGNRAMSTTYLAYDGSQEIQGYVILTYFEKYLFCYHFLCAYEDYPAFETSMRRMRDSVQPDQSQLDD